MKTANEAYKETLRNVAILNTGTEVTPRGYRTREVRHWTTQFDSRFPVVNIPARKLNHRFMAAEARWILEGRDDVEFLLPFNKSMSKFSDDGVFLAGAYGPKILPQIPYVVRTLNEDRCSRQAVINIWRESPEKSRDIPCTLSLIFTIRDDKLHTHAFMRSSDIWLGLPYDMFTFTMVGYYVITQLGYDDINPGTTFITAASSHYYIQSDDFPTPSLQELMDVAYFPCEGNEVGAPMVMWKDKHVLFKNLTAIMDKHPSARWWEDV